MAKIDHMCPYCGGRSLRVRSSEKIGLLTIKAVIYCNSCIRKMEVTSQITRVWNPTYQECPEALRAHKPLLQCDVNTQDMFDEAVEKPV